MPKRPEYYLVEELAAKLRVHQMTIYRYLKAGKLHAHKIGKAYRISKADFDRFMVATKR